MWSRGAGSATTLTRTTRLQVMRTFLIRRLLAAIPLIIVVSFITKALLVISPGNYLDNLRLNPTISRDYLASMERLYHLDSDNVFERYWYWLWPALRGDFGYSFTKTMPVWSLIGERVLNTLLLTGSAMAFSWVLRFARLACGGVSQSVPARWSDCCHFSGCRSQRFFSLLMVLFAAKPAVSAGGDPQPGLGPETPWEK